MKKFRIHSPRLLHLINGCIKNNPLDTDWYVQNHFMYCELENISKFCSIGMFPLISVIIYSVIMALFI